MKKPTQLVAISLILLAFSSGMVLTAATSGCDSSDPALNGPSTANLEQRNLAKTTLGEATLSQTTQPPHGAAGWTQE